MRTKIVGLILLGAIASTSAVAVSAAPSADPNAATVADTRQHDDGFDDWGLLGLLGLLGLIPRKTREVHVRPATEGVNR